MKIKVHFTLVGKTDQWQKFIKDKRDAFTNADNLEYIKDLVEEQFGKRSTFVVNEKMLCADAVTYPKYFSACWFIEESGDRRELVVIAHGDTMEAANKSVLENVKNVNWDKLSSKI